MATQAKPRKPQPSAADRKKSAWRRSNDAGPHTATLPSGMVVTFRIPDSTQLLRSDMLPDRLSEIAIMAAAYPDGAEGYMADLGLAAMRDPEQAVKLKSALKEGLELRDWLVSYMMIDPPVTPEELASGDFPRVDIDMLVQFAERRRNTDAAGVKFAITILDDLAAFREQRAGEEDDAAVSSGEDPAPDVAGGADDE